VDSIVRLVGPQQAVELLGIRLVGVNAVNGRKLLLTLLFIAAVLILSRLLRAFLRLMRRWYGNERAYFWGRQAIRIFTVLLMVVGVVSIWFDDPTRLATAAGLVTAGLAFALQRVVTAVAGYFVILRGKSFRVGDRITMGGVRGDVIGLSIIQTTIMEMGQPPGEQGDAPSMWVQARQYSGRIVTVSNDKIFDTPVYNYTREFPYLWEEIRIPIPYGGDRRTAERILLETARRHTVPIAEMGRDALEEMRRRYFMHDTNLEPRVYFRLTDNWTELTVRFVAKTEEIRPLKDKMSREILDGLEAAGIGIASGTYQIVGMPPLEVRLHGPAA
jgi:small-conductance mechanosensitive channel